MTVQEIVEEFCELPKSEQDKVVAYLMGLPPSENGRKVRPEVSAKFREIAAEVFTTNDKLFRKLED